MVSFGDSLSDLGTCTIAKSQVAGVAPHLRGRFTTDSHTGYASTNSPLSNTATIWVESPRTWRDSADSTIATSSSPGPAATISWFSRATPGLGQITPITAVANMATAGTELANLIKNQIVANGATRVVAMNLPDPGGTPDHSARTTQDRAFLTDFVIGKIKKFG